MRDRIMKTIIDDFLESTTLWAEQSVLSKDDPCMVCGIIPANMVALAEAVKELREKAWKYDDLCK